jgi:putative toxin-antitoxin system antitoxin component (TIGR02293 family)
MKPAAIREPRRRASTALLHHRDSSLGFAYGDTPALIQRIQEGFAFSSLESLESATGLAQGLLAQSIGIPERTLARRKSVGRLAPEESERLLRIANLFEKSTELFEGNSRAAVSWLTTPKKELGQQTPLAYARTEIGAREVENLIGRLEHGVFS